jgi:histidinol phosphatase-like enzyme
VLEFAMKHDVDLTRSIVVGDSAADRTIAERLHSRRATVLSFFER